MADRHGHHRRRTARKAARLASEVRDREKLARRYGSAVAALVGRWTRRLRRCGLRLSG